MRGESLIAIGRITLAALSAVALLVDPITPSSLGRIAFLLLIAYLAYAVVLGALCVRYARALPPWIAVGTHIIDLSVTCVLSALSAGSSSPFFVFFTFAMATATLRWQARGAMWSAAAALAMLAAMALYQSATHDPNFELNRSIVRATYLVVIAAVLSQLGAFERRRRDEVASLAAWPRPTSHDLALVLTEGLSRAATLLRVHRTILVWEDPDEPWWNVAQWNGVELSQWKESPDAFAPPVHDALAPDDFYVRDASDSNPLVVRAALHERAAWRGAPLNNDFVRRFELTAVLAIRVIASRVQGRLFFAGGRSTTSDDLALASVAAQRVGEALDAYQSTRQLNEVAVLEERERLSHELHDGVLQSLAGLGFLLRRAELSIAADPLGAAASLTEAQRVLGEEQRDIRFFVQGLRYSASASYGRDIEARLTELVNRIGAVWSTQVTATVNVPGVVLGVSQEHALLRIAQEAILNAARHGGAKSVRVELLSRNHALLMTVTDDGHGFAFKGHFEHTELQEGHIGPVTLKARVKSLGGTMSIDSRADGAQLEIVIPLRLPKEGE